MTIICMAVDNLGSVNEHFKFILTISTRSSIVIEVIRSILNFLFFIFYKNILQTPLATKSIKLLTVNKNKYA